MAAEGVAGPVWCRDMAGADALEQGRRSYEELAWADAYARLSAADGHHPLGPEDLERLATAAYLLGRDDDGADGRGACPSRVPAPR
jgi:hypothetical protein